jgi:hypothetical protein
MENEEAPKGAFKDYPKEQQPARIPMHLFPALAEKVKGLLLPYGQVFIPDATKKSTKTTTGDLDVLYIPNDPKNWQATVQKAIPGIVAVKTNALGAMTDTPNQLMMVVKGLVDENQYMIDVLLTSEQEKEFKQLYFKFGPIVPAILGSFARMLGYKFAADGLYIRRRDSKNNYHNIKLTNDPETALKIFKLDSSIVDTEQLYDPVGVANWVMSSPRFDSERWRNPPSDDGITVVVQNHKAHRAAKKKPEVILTYQILDNSNKKGTWRDDNLEIERQILGNQFVDNILKQICSNLDHTELISFATAKNPELLEKYGFRYSAH